MLFRRAARYARFIRLFAWAWLDLVPFKFQTLITLNRATAAVPLSNRWAEFDGTASISVSRLKPMQALDCQRPLVRGRSAGPALPRMLVREVGLDYFSHINCTGSL